MCSRRRNNTRKEQSAQQRNIHTWECTVEAHVGVQCALRTYLDKNKVGE
jgi:hypothetical protein